MTKTIIVIVTDININHFVSFVNRYLKFFLKPEIKNVSIKNESGKAGGWVNIKASREELYNRIAKKNRKEE